MSCNPRPIRFCTTARVAPCNMGCAIALGFYAASSPDGIADRLSRLLAIAGQALPSFAVGLILLWFLAAELQWIRPYSGGTLERLVLPICLVALFSIGGVSRIVRAAFADVRVAGYFRTALGKGLAPDTALWRHGRRHAALTLMAGFAPELAWIVGGTAVAEIVFGVPGVSERIVEAVAARDYAVLQPYVALVALWIILVLQGAAVLLHPPFFRQRRSAPANTLMVGLS